MHIVSYKKSKNTRMFDLQYINSSIFTSVKYRLTFLVQCIKHNIFTCASLEKVSSYFSYVNLK